jgi:very-short-patch-repair endonuclease
MGDPADFSARIQQKARQNAVWRAISALARRQCGVISLKQLQSAGLTYAQVRRLLERGLLIRLHQGVYAVGQLPQLTKGYLVAALLAGGPDAFLSHRTAAAVYGLREVSIARIDVTVPGSKRRSRGTLRFHRTTQQPTIKTRNGLRVSSLPDMLIELAPHQTRQELDRLITQSVRKNLLDLQEMERALNGQPGAAKLRKALERYLPRPDRKSDLERAFDRLLAQHPEIPEPQRNIYIDGWEIDCYWPEQRLAVELDGRPYHVAVADIERDRVKDAKLMLQRIRILRITDHRFELDPRGVFEDVLAALALGAPGPATG